MKKAEAKSVADRSKIGYTKEPKAKGEEEWEVRMDMPG